MKTKLKSLDKILWQGKRFAKHRFHDSKVGRQAPVLARSQSRRHGVKARETNRNRTMQIQRNERPKILQEAIPFHRSQQD